MKKIWLLLVLFVSGCAQPMVCQNYGTGQICVPATFQETPSTDPHPEIVAGIIFLVLVFGIDWFRVSKLNKESWFDNTKDK